MRSAILTRLISRRWRLPVGAALLIALLPRVFIPVGYMPEAGAASGLRMCASAFPAALLAFADAARVAAHVELMAQLDQDALAAHLAGMAQNAGAAHAGGHGPGEHEGHEAGAGEHCVFAALAANALLSLQQEPFAGATLRRFLLVSALALPGSGQRHFLPQARAPPAVS